MLRFIATAETLKPNQTIIITGKHVHICHQSPCVRKLVSPYTALLSSLYWTVAQAYNSASACIHSDTLTAPHACVCALQAAAEGSTLGVPITELALLNTFTLLLWQLKAVQQHDPAEGQSTSADPAVGLGERVLIFCGQLEGIFTASGDAQRLQDCVFRIQADAFLVFSSDKLEVSFSHNVVARTGMMSNSSGHHYVQNRSCIQFCPWNSSACAAMAIVPLLPY